MTPPLPYPPRAVALPMPNVPPKVVIVGRPNVGKSSILNMLARRRVAIVDPTAGVTRDRISTDLELPPERKGGATRWCEVVDTGGYGVYAGDATYHVLTEDIERQIAIAVDEADLVLFVVDAQSGLTPLDQQVADLLRKRVGRGVAIQVVANKADNETLELEAMEAANLGLGEPVAVSAANRRNKWGLLETIAELVHWPAEAGPPEGEAIKLAVVGKRNAGKSTFVNALAGAERVIASDLPGTTRDSIDVTLSVDGRPLTLIDTAGLRKRKSIEDDIEYYSTHRTLRSVRRADVVILMVDAAEVISQVDKKLSHEVLTEYKPTVIVLNKWDLVENELEPEQYVDYVGDALRGLDFAPIVCASALHNDHVREAVRLAVKLYDQAGQRVSTGELNQCLREILAQRGPSSKLGKRAKVFFATQAETHPPTIILFVNHPELFTDQYQRYMLNNFRERLPFEEVPIKLVIRGRARRQHGEPEEPVAEA